jgi:hypothetical protein
METVELRVHGVHGTSPGAMLGVADNEAGQVAGDGLTGIYRSKDGKLPYRDLSSSKVSVEAYSWGALTSSVQGFLGWIKRALWLLLLPFALVNLAYWARIALARGTGQARWGARAVRVSGLLLTIFFVVTPCVVAVDMGAWQCFRYGVPGCSVLPGWLNFLGGWDPGQRIALATTVPMALVMVLWLLSKGTIKRYESVAVEPGMATSLPTTGHVLVHPKLWDGSERTLRLQRFHLAAAAAAVIAFTGIHLLAAGWGALVLWSAAGLVLTLLVACLLFAVAVAAVCGNHPNDVEWIDEPDGERPLLDRLGARLTPRFDAAVIWVALAAYLVHVLVLSTLHVSSGEHLDESIDYVGRNVWFIALFVLLTVLHLSVFAGGRMSGRAARAIALSPLLLVIAVEVLRRLGLYDADTAWTVLLMAVVAILFWVVLARWQYRHSPDEHRDKAWRGAGASVLLAAAAWVALLFASSAVVASANWLNGYDHGVGDLVSRVEVDDPEANAPTTLYLGSEQSTRKFVATGDITLRGARVTLVGDHATVSSGTVEMKGLSLKLDSDYAPTEDFTAGRGRTVVAKKASTLTVPARALVLSDSCLTSGGSPCTAEDEEFRNAGVLTLPAGTGPLTITLAKGVVLDPSDAPEVPLAVPQVLIWTTIGQLLWLLLVAVALGVCLRRFGKHIGAAIDRHYADDANWLEDIAARDRDRCVPARRTAALAHRAESLLDVIGAITAPVALVVIVTSMSGVPPWDMPGLGWTRAVATASMWLVVGMSAGLVALGSQIRRSEKARKAVGVIWDLTTFWPRAAHPLAPPCYAERVIPELQIRARWVLDKPQPSGPANQLILSGHSQGSLIVLATVSRFGPEHLARTRMITYGSQIRALYGRIFPRVFGPDAVGNGPTDGTPTLRDPHPDIPPPPDTRPGPPVPAPGSVRQRLTAAGGEWVNLFRRTDPLGWRVFSDVDSEVDRPVAEVPPDGIGDPGPQVMGHSGYQHTRVYRQQLRRWTKEPFVPDPPGTRNLPILPPL